MTEIPPLAFHFAAQGRSGGERVFCDRIVSDPLPRIGRAPFPGRAKKEEAAANAIADAINAEIPVSERKHYESVSAVQQADKKWYIVSSALIGSEEKGKDGRGQQIINYLESITRPPQQAQTEAPPKPPARGASEAGGLPKFHPEEFIGGRLEYLTVVTDPLPKQPSVMGIGNRKAGKEAERLANEFNIRMTKNEQKNYYVKPILLDEKWHLCSSKLGVDETEEAKKLLHLLNDELPNRAPGAAQHKATMAAMKDGRAQEINESEERKWIDLVNQVGAARENRNNMPESVAKALESNINIPPFSR